MKTLLIAQAAHAINLAYCLSIGDDTQKPWEEISDELRKSAEVGVQFRLNNLDAPVSAQHEAWMADKTANGWVFGEEKDEEAKTHPCLVPFDELPVEQKTKDYLFTAVVKALNAVPEEVVTKTVYATPAKVVQVESKAGLTPVKYIGLRAQYTDGTYGTRISFNKGETKLVPTEKAMLMLKHSDQYALGEEEGAKVAVLNQTPEDKDDEEELQNARDAVANMDVESLRTYAATNFSGHKLHHNVGVEKARQVVLGLIDQYGIVK